MPNLITLSSQELGIQLPVADLGNTIKLVNDLQVKKTMTGVGFTYVRRSNKELIKYRLTLSKIKADLLMDFLAQYGSDLLILVDWNNIEWGGYLINMPWTFTQSKNFTETDLVFEGIRIVAGGTR